MDVRTVMFLGIEFSRMMGDPLATLPADLQRSAW